VTVADYRCRQLAVATAEILGDGFALGDVSGSPDGYEPNDDSIVIDQSPNPGQKRPRGSSIDLVVSDGNTLATCPP
jgi:beta-lactam-binding protein with PASTA domain